MPKDIVGRGWAFPVKIAHQGGLSITNEYNELIQAIKIILMTAPGQRVMRPTFGCRIHELVFAPNNIQTATLARQYVEDALRMWEPRIVVEQIHVRPDPDHPHMLMIMVEYKVKATNDRRSLVYPFYLIPEEE